MSTPLAAGATSRFRDLTGAQLRAARALLNLTIAELAAKTGLAVNTIRRAEATDGSSSITAANRQLLIDSLEQAGVAFIAAGEQGVGVRFAAPTMTTAASNPESRKKPAESNG